MILLNIFIGLFEKYFYKTAYDYLYKEEGAVRDINVFFEDAEKLSVGQEEKLVDVPNIAAVLSEYQIRTLMDTISFFNTPPGRMFMLRRKIISQLPENTLKKFSRFLRKKDIN